MNSKERFLAALRANGVPDRVPCAPDFSNYIPCKLAGLPFWDIYFFGAMPLWRAYLDAVDRFGTEAWIASAAGVPLLFPEDGPEVVRKVAYDKLRDAMVESGRIRTREGDLTYRNVCFRADPPSPVEKPMKDLAADWPKFRATLRPPVGIDLARVEEMRAACEERGQAFGMTLGYPGFHMWMCHVQGGVEPLVYAEHDHPEILGEWFERDLEIGTESVALALSAKPDYLLLGGSGTLTLASPALARKYALPALKKWSAMARAAGVPTMLHSCGRERALVDMLCDETSVDCVNPLEIAPMGDVDLAEVKRARGRQISLMGNLHTTDVMLRGTPDVVRKAARDAIRAAAPGGGFILSTGDQCARDTPEENLFALVEAATAYGRYDADGSLAED
ncbi:MAG: uroporphyrinogen decarboxylase family protein [Kiritimatiellia bacterium]|jgi:uroporphyrinogen decarboxylase